MENSKSIEDIRKEFYKLTSRLPEWILGRFDLNHKVWNLMDEGNTVISILLTDIILSEKSINKIIEKFDEVILKITDLGISNQLQIKIAIYWLELVNTMTKICLDEQQYECCSNLKKFTDMYLIPLPDNE